MSVQTPNGFQLDTSGQRIVVDPVTRIEGHMRCEVNLDENNVIRNAVSTGTMWRGLEVILRGRDPRDAWAFTERICGVCTGTHALTSVRAVEDALGIQIPENANSIRNIMQLTLQAHDHLVHFYHLHALDWVDVVSALKADPKATSALAQSISDWPLSSPGYFRDVQNRIKRFVESGQLGPFMNGYWGNPAYKLPPEANLMAVTHYLEALDFQKEIVKIHTIYGGKNPHPNWLVGGVPCAINVHDTGAVGAVNMERLNLVSSIIDRTIEFIDKVYIPDLLAIASFYKDWTYGGGLSSQAIMSYGDIPDRANDDSADNQMLPRGAIINGKLNEVHDVDLRDPEQIQEFVAHSWFTYKDESKGLHPWDGVTEPNFVLGPNTKGSKTRIEEIDEGAKYSWIKAPRWRGHAMEVGPAGALGDRLRQGHPGVQGAGGEGADRPATAGRGALLDPGTHRRARSGRLLGGAQDALFPGQADGQPQGRRQQHRQYREVGPQHLAERGQGRRHDRGPARRAGSLDRHQGRQDRQLPGRGPDHLERLAARSGGQHRRLRGGPDEHPGGGGRSAAGDPAHPAQLRPLSGLLDPCHESGWGGADAGEGSVR